MATINSDVLNMGKLGPRVNTGAGESTIDATAVTIGPLDPGVYEFDATSDVWILQGDSAVATGWPGAASAEGYSLPSGFKRSITVDSSDGSSGYDTFVVWTRQTADGTMRVNFVSQTDTTK